MRWTQSDRQAAERLASAMGCKLLRRKGKSRTVVVHGKLRSGEKKKGISTLGYLVYVAMDIEGHSARQVVDMCRWSGSIPFKSGMAAHEEMALAHVVKIRSEMRA